jgi:hypothetical protein
LQEIYLLKPCVFDFLAANNKRRPKKSQTAMSLCEAWQFFDTRKDYYHEKASLDEHQSVDV